MKNKLTLMALFAFTTLAGCSTLQTPDAKVTLPEPYVLTERGLVEQDKADPETYRPEQVIEAGDYMRADIERIAPGQDLPAGATVTPGESPSALENILTSLGGVAGSIPGGQPVGALLLGAAGVAKIWRDSRRIKDTEKVARTLASARDAALDTVATLPDRATAERLEQEINSHTEHFAKGLGKTRDFLDQILKETETPTKKQI